MCYHLQFSKTWKIMKYRIKYLFYGISGSTDWKAVGIKT